MKDEELEQEPLDSQAASYDDSDDDDADPKEEAFMKGYDEADNIEADWDFVKEADE